MNGNPYAVLDKQVGYKEALETMTELRDSNGERLDIDAYRVVARLFGIQAPQLARDIQRLDANQCIACGGEKVIRKDRWNPLNSQWEPHYVDCQECEE